MYQFQKASPPADSRFSILIPTWNNLAYLKCCLNSIRKHSAFPHEIIIHVNDGSDGTLEWIRDQGLSYSATPENVGICFALNAAASLATTDYIAFLNDDMYALPDWDLYLWEEIEKLGDQPFFLSGTMIEPRDTGNASVLAPFDFGQSLESFREEELLASYKEMEKKDWQGGTWPPNVLPRWLWELVGGYSVEFSPGMSSDPDFSMKLWKAGVRYFKGIGKSRVYHFQARSTGKVKKNKGNHQFLHKWEITQSTFFRHYLRRGKDWDGVLKEPEPTNALKLMQMKSRLKRLFT